MTTVIKETKPATWIERFSKSKDAKGLNKIHSEVVKIFNPPSKYDIGDIEKEKSDSITF